MDEASLEPVLAEIDAAGVTSIAICLLHAYANPIHEQRLAELISAKRPDLSLSLSSEVSPEVHELDGRPGIHRN